MRMIMIIILYNYLFQYRTMQDKLSLRRGAHSLQAVPKQLRIDSRNLFAGHTEITIQHGGQEYRLRRTRNGKLILNK